jgi:diguanylate cyclase (GGDEF)-like protein
MNGKPPSLLSYLIIGSSKGQRLRLKQTLFAGASYCLFLILHGFEVHAGMIDQDEDLWLTLFCLAGIVLFYGLIRSGLSARISQDPSLIMPQQIFGIVAVIWTYAIAGPDRGATIGILALVLMFGAFRFHTGDIVKLSLLALALLAIVLLWQCWHDPTSYPPDIAISHFFYAATIIWPISVLTAWTGELQKKLATQKAALQKALEQIKRQAESDDLTGLINRRAAMPVLQSEIAARHQGHGPICLALLDIDRFKTVNDKYGHQTGDEALRMFAKLGKTALRAGDMFARWGGEEFLLMLPDSSITQGVECIERLRTTLATASFDFVSPGFKLTLSAGVTDLRKADTLETLLERADQAMYQAKKMGRDMIITSSGPSGLNLLQPG